MIDKYKIFNWVLSALKPVGQYMTLTHTGNVGLHYSDPLATVLADDVALSCAGGSVVEA